MLLPPVFLPQEPGSLCRELRVGVLLRSLTRTAPGGVSAGPIRCGPRGHLLRTPFVCRISRPRLPSLLQFGFRAPPTHTACLSKGCLLPALGPGAKGCDSPPLPHEGPPRAPPGPAQPFCAAAGGPSTSLPRPSASDLPSVCKSPLLPLSSTGGALSVRFSEHSHTLDHTLRRVLDATQPSCWASWKIPSPTS